MLKDLKAQVLLSKNIGKIPLNDPWIISTNPCRIKETDNDKSHLIGRWLDFIFL